MAQRFTSRVRRGFGWLVDQGLERNVQQFMANAMAKKQITKADVKDIESAISYIKEQAHGQQMADVSGQEDPGSGA